jgi:hypothetical protein
MPWVYTLSVLFLGVLDADILSKIMSWDVGQIRWGVEQIRLTNMILNICPFVRQLTDIDGQKDKYSVLNECSRMLKYKNMILVVTPYN